MVAVAAERAGTDARLSGAVFDQGAIDFGDASFDAVINRHGLMFVEEPAQTVAEAVRVLRGRGRYAAMTWIAGRRTHGSGLCWTLWERNSACRFHPRTSAAHSRSTPPTC